jgi:hypothetical protein
MDAVSAAWTLARRGHWHSREATLVQQGGRPDVDSAKERGRHSGEREAVATIAGLKKPPNRCWAASCPRGRDTKADI